MKTAIIADDHQLVRDTIKPILEQHLDIQVLGGASDGRAAVEMAVKLRPDIVLMDVSMPRLNGIEATRQIVAQCPNTKVLAVSMHSDVRFVTRMLQAGATGFFVKDRGVSDLIEAVRTVIEGGRYLPHDIPAHIVDNVAGATHEPVPLSTREREVLQLIAEGRTTREIAGELGIAIKTAEAHRGRLMQKLDIHSVAELTKYAIREGLTTLPDQD